jgi:predicted MPP superfamily phosphohydrolase
LQHHLSQINTNQFQVLALQEKLRKSEEKIETIVEFHSKEKTGLLKKIQELEKQSNELKPQLDLNKFKSNYFELLGLLDVYDGGHQEAVQKIQEMLCKSLETTKLSNITENLCDELGVQTDQIVTKVKGIQENTKIERKLYQKLADLLVQCSPKGKFNGLPSCQQVWKWVTRILEDYMSIKKELKL